MGFAFPAWAATTERVGGVLVTVTPGPEPASARRPTGTTHGYAMHQVELNNTTNQSKTVRLTLPGRSYGGDGSDHVELRRAVKLAAGATTTVPLYQPAAPIDGEGLGAAVGGERITFDWYAGNHGHADDDGAVMLVSPRLTDRSGRLIKMVETADGERHTIELSNLLNKGRFILRDSAATWPTDWLAYSRYEAVLVLDEDMARLTPATRSALRRYVVAGGMLCVVGRWRPAADWPVMPIDNPTRRELADYRCGFGRVIVSPLDRQEALNAALPALLRDRTSPWRERLGVMEANDRFPIVDELRIPVRGMLVLLVVFALAMGPVNMLVLGRLNKRMWMLWTVPAAALAASGLVWGYAIFSEGWTGRERTAGLTLLNQKTDTATTIGWSAFYSPLTAGGGLRFERNTELTPQLGGRDRDHSIPRRRAGRTGGGRARAVDWTGGQHLASGWLVARVPAHFKLRKSATAERRAVTFSRSSADPERVHAVNALGVDIERLIYRDPDGTVYRTANLRAGRKQTLTPMLAADAPAIDLPSVYEGPWLDRFARLRANPEQAAPRGGYVAILNEAPFIESALDGARREARSIVVGLTEAGHDRHRARALNTTDANVEGRPETPTPTPEPGAGAADRGSRISDFKSDLSKINGHIRDFSFQFVMRGLGGSRARADGGRGGA